jgi:hypothetical protein
MSRGHDRRTVLLAAAATALGLLVAAPAAQAVDGTGTADGVAPSPTITVSPGCGTGDVGALDVVMNNVDSADNPTFELDEDEDVVLKQIASGPGGHRTLAFPTRGNGVHTIDLWLAAPGEEIAQLVASDTYQVPCPTVAVSPRQRALHEGPQPLRLTAAGYYYDDEDVVFRLDGVQIAQAAPGVDGQARATTTLPAVPDCGSHVISTDYAQPPHAPAGTVTTAQATLVVTCPTLTPAPSSVPQASLPGTVLVTGAGWDLGSDVALSIDGDVVATATTDRSGQFTTAVPVATRPCGTVAVSGVELARAVIVASAAVLPAPRATTSVEVTCPTITPTVPTPPAVPPVLPAPPVPAPPTFPAPPTTPAPTLMTDPVVPSGGVAVASGHGFTPGATVRLAWVLPDATIAPGGSSTVAAADGTITVPCLVLPHARLGPRTLRAAEPGGAATAPVLVVNGPMEPGRDRLLGRR